MSGYGVDGDPGVRRLVDGVLLPGFAGTIPPPWLARTIEEGLGGVVYFARNIADTEQTADLSRTLHDLREDVLIAVDEEGGDVTRLEARDGSSVPGNAALGRIDDEGLTEAVAGQIGRALRLAGVDLDLAPDVDVNTNPDNPVIGTRSFGAETAAVARHAAAYVRGLQGAGVAACAKHFPGHGATDVDSHVDLPVLDADLATLRERDLPPFAAAIAAGVRAVLTAHIRFPALDAAPATLSAPILGLLREELGFDGVVVTDALDMRAIAGGVGMGGGAVLSLAAGADLVCLGNPADDEGEFRLVRGAVLDAVAAGELATARLEQACARVAVLAAWVAKGRGTPVPDAAAGLGLDAARRAVAVTGSARLTAAPHVVDLRADSNRAAGRQAPHLLAELSRRRPATTSSLLAMVGGVGTNGTDGADIGAVLAAARDRSLVAIVSEPQRDRTQAAHLAALLAARPDTVVVCTGWPDGRQRLGDHSVVAFGAARVNAQAAAEVLLG
jgi:beta-N-acetylhexosaminidase